MSTVFLLCAMVGGTILVCQVVMTLIGLGHHDFSFDHDALPHADVAAVHHDASLHDSEHPGVNWFFGILTFRTLVAAVTFFGWIGMAAQAAELALPTQLLAAGAAGLGAMWLVHRVMRLFYRLGQDDTVRIQRAIGQVGTVYVPIPPAREAAGKVNVKLQGRLMEYEAVTDSANPLETGAKVVVVAVVGVNTLAVEALPPAGSATDPSQDAELKLT